MSGVYVVLAINDKAEVEACETYAGVQTALGRAWHLAVAKSGSNPIWANPSPQEEKLEDGSVRWVMLETSKHFVAVFYKTIETALTSKKDVVDVVRTMSWQTKDGYNVMKPPVDTSAPPMSFSDGYSKQTIGDLIRKMLGGTSTPTPVQRVLPLDDPYEKSLPAGWNGDGKPITIEQMLADPDNAQHSNELSEAQQWALVIARVNKRPGLKLGGFAGELKTQATALKDLKERNADGLAIKSHDLYLLDKLLNDQNP